MKNLLTGLSLLLLISFSINLKAQDAKPFTGIVSYKVTALGGMSAAEKAQIEGTVISYYGDNVYKSVSETQMMTQTQIAYPDSVISITESMGQTMAFRMTTEQAEELAEQMKGGIEEDELKPVVTKISETKMIAGFKCKKAEIELGDNIMEVYYYDEYTVPEFTEVDEFEGINGILMEYSIPNPRLEGSSIHYIATEVKKKKKMKAKTFQIPAGQKVMSFEELKALMGG